MASGTVRIARAPAAREEDAPIAQAYAALKAGDSGRAELLYRRALMLEPERREALLGLAALAQRRGDVTTAYAQYQAVLARYPDDPAATAGVLALTAADGADAAARLRLLLDRNPDAAYLHAALGHHLARESRWADAQQAYFDAVRLDPNNADFAYDLAVSLDHLGQTRAALDYYQKALNLAVRGPVSVDADGVQTRIQALAPTVPVE
jgi:Flp pilus assembly protein TadD